MIRKTRVIAGVICLVYCVSVYGQSTGGSSPSWPAATSAAGSSTVPVESEMIAYEAVAELATEIGDRISRAAVSPTRLSQCTSEYATGRPTKWDIDNREPDKKDEASHKRWEADREKNDASLSAAAAASCGVADKVLLGTTASMVAIGMFRNYQELGNLLVSQYEDAIEAAKPNAKPQPAKPRIQLFDAPTPLTGFGPISAAASTVAGALNTLKGQTTQTSGSFAPVEQVLYSDLEKAFDQKNKTLVIMPYPGDYAKGNLIAVNKYDDVFSKRSEAVQAYRDKFDRDHPKASPEDKSKYSPTDLELKALETSFTAFQGVRVASRNFLTICLMRILTSSPSRCAWQLYLSLVQFDALIWATLVDGFPAGVRLAILKGRDRRRSGLKCGNRLVLCDFQGRWKGWEAWSWLSMLSTDRHFHRLLVCRFGAFLLSL